MLVTLDTSGHVLLWDVAAEHTLAELPVVNLPFIYKYDVAFSPDGTLVAIAGAPSVVVDTKTLREVFARPTAARPGPDTSVAFSADGRMLATANGSEVEFLDVAAGREARPPLKAGGNVNQIQFSPDGGLLATGLADGTTQLWDTSTLAPDGGPLVGQQGVISQTAFVPYSSLLVTATNTSVAVWDTALVRPLSSTQFRGDGAAITGAAYSSGGRWAAASSSAGRVELWRLSAGTPTGPPVLLSSDSPDRATAVAFSPDGRQLVVGRSDGSVMSFDPAAPAKSGRSVRGAGDGVTALAFAPGAALLAVGGADGTIALLNPRTGSVRKVISSHQGGPVGGLAFSPDGSRLASSGADGRLIVDDVRGSGSTVLAVRTPDPMNGVAYRPDGHAVAVADSGGMVTLVQAPDGVRSSTLSPGGGPVEAVAFSPDGRLLATASADGTVRLWDPDSDRPVGTQLAGPATEPRVLAFSPQGREMVTGSTDGTIVFWSAAPAAWAVRVCDLAGRTLTRPEWAQLLPGRGYHPACATRNS
jgi:WD40 repeat protein